MFLCDFCGLLFSVKKKLSDHLRIHDEESVHSRYRMFEEKHGYSCNKKGSLDHIRKQHKSVIHFNSLNIGDV